MYLCQRVQEHQLVRGQIDMGPIESLRLVLAWQPKEYQHMISSACQLHCFLQQLLVVVGSPNAETSGKPHLRSAGKCRLQLLQCHVDSGGIDLRAAGALEPRRTREFADHCDCAA